MWVPIIKRKKERTQGSVRKLYGVQSSEYELNGLKSVGDAGAADIRPAGRSSEWKCQWMDCWFMRRRWLLYSLGPYQRKVHWCFIKPSCQKKVEEQVVKKKRRPSCQKKSRRPSCQKKRRRAGLQTAQRSRAPGWQTLTAASNNQTTPHTNLHFSFFHNIVNALLPFIQCRWLKCRNWRQQPPEF